MGKQLDFKSSFLSQFFHFSIELGNISVKFAEFSPLIGKSDNIWPELTKKL